MAMWCDCILQEVCLLGNKANCFKGFHHIYIMSSLQKLWVSAARLLICSSLLLFIFSLPSAYAVSFSASPNPFTLSNTVIDIGQVSTASSVVSFGSNGPFSGEWTWINANQVNNPVVNTINLDTINPYGVVFNPSGTLAYVTTDGGAGVNVIQVSSNSVVNVIAVSGAATGIAVNPSGTLVYVTTDSNLVEVIDAASNSVVNTIPVGSNPLSIAINPSNTLAYVAEYAQDTVNVIQLSSNSVVNTINVGSKPQYVTFNPSGTLAYVVDQ